MEWVETTGKSVEEAKERALDQLGVDEADAEFELVSDAKLGLFGRIRAEARVRARVRPAVPRPKEDRNRRRRRGSQDRQSPITTGRPTEQAAEEEESEDSGAFEVDQDGVDEGDRPSPDRTSGRGRRGRRKPANKHEGVATVEDVVDLGHQGEVAKEFLAGLMDRLHSASSIEVAVREDDEIVSVGVEGSNLGHLIGPRGATLHALQELTRTVVQRRTGARNGRIIVDVAHYREKRREALEKFSQQVADEVLRTGTQKVLEPMNPSDRKIVHDSINTIEGVATTSQGEEPLRRVVIKPAGPASGH